jgi:hypothetical protein
MATARLQPALPPTSLTGKQATFVSNCGRYEIKGDRVIHHVEASLDPNMTGEPVERFMQLSSKRLSLSLPPFSLFGEPHTGHLVWERV